MTDRSLHRASRCLPNDVSKKSRAVQIQASVAAQHAARCTLLLARAFIQGFCFPYFFRSTTHSQCGSPCSMFLVRVNE